MDRKADIQRVRGGVRHLELVVVPSILSGSEFLSLFPLVEGRLKPGLARAVRVAAVDVVFHRGSPHTGAVVAELGMDLRPCVAWGDGGGSPERFADALWCGGGAGPVARGQMSA
jgi:hypothetical protein